MSEKKYRKDTAFFKPRKDGGGACAKFSLNDFTDDPYVFLTLAPQKGEKEFDYTPEKTIKVKLGQVDLAQMLLVLEGTDEKLGQEGKGIYHKSPGGASIIHLDKVPLGDSFGYSFKVIKTDPQGNKLMIGITLLKHEAIVLRELFKRGIVIISYWHKNPND